MKIDYTKYVISFVITLSIFLTAFYISNYFSNKRVDLVKNIQENISIDILSNEAQFDLLGETSCSNLDSSILSSELTEIGNKLNRTQEELGHKDSQVIYLKKYYSLLEIKDYLLNKRLAEKCEDKKIGFVIYMYSETGCEDCDKQGYTLDKLKTLYPGLRIYTFDYNLDLSVIETLKKIYKLRGEFPIIIINNTPYFGFRNLEDLEQLLPEYMKIKAEEMATSTVTASTSRAKSPSTK